MKNIVKIFFCSVSFLFITFTTNSQQQVSFKASDGLLVTADLYKSGEKNPYLILCHQAHYSRGEYRETARKLMKLGYNCLAVDLRSGGEVNYIQNETALLAQSSNVSHDFIDASKDINAAIDFIYKIDKKRIILVGSSYSASLCLMIAKKDSRIKAVIAFSPGEFFYPRFSVRDSLSGLNKPAFICCSSFEYPYIEKLVENIPHGNLSLFKPQSGQTTLGSKILWNDNPYHNEYWLALLMFINKIKDTC